MFLALLRKKPVLCTARSRSAMGAVEPGGRFIRLEQLAGDDVHAGVGTLCRQDRGDQKLKRRVVDQCALRDTVPRPQPLNDFGGMAFGGCGSDHEVNRRVE